MVLWSATTRAVVTAIVVLAGLLATAAAPASAATLTGVAFKDLDRDSAWQPAEPPLADQEIYLFAAHWAVPGAGRHRRVRPLHVRRPGRGRVPRRLQRAVVVGAAPGLGPDHDGGSLEPSRDVTVSGTTAADFGWRPIVRSTDLTAPISAYTGPSGLKVSSYDDVVSARTLHDALAAARIGAEAPYTEVRFDLYGGSMTSASAAQSNGGPYERFKAVSYVSYITWLDSGDRTLTHEYGHAWSLYNAYIVQQDPALAAYLRVRGLEGDSRDQLLLQLVGERADRRGLPAAVRIRERAQRRPDQHADPARERRARARATTSPDAFSTPAPPPPPPPADAAADADARAHASAHARAHAGAAADGASR